MGSDTYFSSVVRTCIPNTTHLHPYHHSLPSPPPLNSIATTTHFHPYHSLLHHFQLYFQAEQSGGGQQRNERVTVTFGADDHIDEVYYDGKDVKSQCKGLGQVRAATFIPSRRRKGAVLA